MPDDVWENGNIDDLRTHFSRVNVKYVLVYNIDPGVSRSDRYLESGWSRLDKNIPLSHRLKGLTTDVTWKVVNIAEIQTSGRVSNNMNPQNYLQLLNIPGELNGNKFDFEQKPSDYSV